MDTKMVICDDEPIFCHIIKEFILEYCRKNNLKCNIHIYNSGEECLSNINDCDILFLDIDMPGMDGIEVGKRVPHINKSTMIVYLTSCVERMQEAFGPQVFSFLCKPVMRERIHHVLEDILKEKKQKHRVAIDFANDCTLYYDTDEVVYIIAQRQYSKIITADKQYVVRKSIREWSEELDSHHFLQTHKSVLINLERVKILDTKITMDNGHVLPIATRRQLETRNAYNNYIRKMAKQVIY